MKDKVKEFKQCLKTFGYRNLNDEKVMAKPLAFLLIYVKVTEVKVVFDVMFRKYIDGSISLWDEHEILFNEDNEYIFENSEELSKWIATTEYKLLASHNIIHTGLKYEPFNFHTTLDLYDI